MALGQGFTSACRGGRGARHAVLAGYGETRYEKRSQKPPIWYVANAIARTLEHTGIEKDEVDGLAVTSFRLPPDNVVTVAEHLGFELNWSFQGSQGGASGVISVLEAAAAVERGQASVVVCVAADAFDVAKHMELMDSFNPGIRDYLAPYGFGGTNGLFALVQRRHMHEFGTRLEDLGKIAVTQRMHAGRNPNALLRDSMSLDDYLSARMIADPIRLYDCVLPCCGGDAVVVSTLERARASDRRPIRILSGGQRHNHRPNDIIMLEGGWVTFRDQLYREAGIDPWDIDLVQLYDDYPIMEVIQFEDLGFAEKGRGGEFVRNTDLSIGGDLPLNTGGGQLSAGQCGAGGGMISVVEAVRQLQGEAEGRQVERARTALVSGFGMVGYVRGLSSSAMILTNA